MAKARAQSTKKLPRLTDRRRIGKRLRVSPFCLGCSADPRVIPAAFDAGINFFFVSGDLHWPYYEGTRRGLRDLLSRRSVSRDDIIVAGVTYVGASDLSIAPLYELIEAVPKLERIDVTTIGGAYRGDFLARRMSHGGHHAHVGSKALGATFHDREAARLALEHGLVDVGFARYNPVHRGAEEDIFDGLTKPERTQLYLFKTTFGALGSDQMEEIGLDRRHWCPTIPDYYRFALASPAVDGLLVTLDTPKHVRELESALAKGHLDEDELAYMRNLGDVLAGNAEVVKDP